MLSDPLDDDRVYTPESLSVLADFWSGEAPEGEFQLGSADLVAIKLQVSDSASLTATFGSQGTAWSEPTNYSDLPESVRSRIETAAKKHIESRKIQLVPPPP